VLVNRPADVSNFTGLLQSAQAALSHDQNQTGNENSTQMDPQVANAAQELRNLLNVRPAKI